MATAHLTTARALAVAAALLALLTPLDPASASGTLTEASAGAAAVPTRSLGARQVLIRYRSHTGAERDAYVLLPRWYGGPRTPAIPLVISPHGRGRDGASNARLWGDLASIGGFAVVSPDGQGNRLRKMSWGAPGQIDDLARMPDILARALPELRIDRSRIYAFGGSMGGH